MTSPKSTRPAPPPPATLAPLRVEGQLASEWLVEHRRALTTRALAAIDDARVAAPAHSGFDRPRQDPELRWIIEYNLELFLSFLDDPTGADLADQQAADLIASAARRAGEGEPIDNLLLDYQIGADAIWQVLAEHCRGGEQDDLLTLTHAVHRYLRQVTAFVVKGFQHESARMQLGDGDARYALFSALVSGEDPHRAADLAGMSLPEQYLVLELHIGKQTDPPAATKGRNPDVVVRRRVNTVQRALERYGPAVLALVRDPVASALIPVGPKVPTSPHGLLNDFAQPLIDELGAPVHVGMSVATPVTVRDAHDESSDVLELALALSLPSGPYSLDEVLVPYQLTRDGPGVRRLRQRLRALDQHPDWEATLRTYLSKSFDRKATAAQMHVHPNTVDYRLTRIAALSGLDAGDPAQRLAAFAGLYIRDLDRHRDDPSNALHR